MKSETRLKLTEIKEPTGFRASIVAVYEYVGGEVRFVRFELTQHGRRGRKPGKPRGRKPGPKSKRRKGASEAKPA